PGGAPERWAVLVLGHFVCTGGGGVGPGGRSCGCPRRRNIRLHDLRRRLSSLVGFVTFSPAERARQQRGVEDQHRSQQQRKPVRKTVTFVQFVAHHGEIFLGTFLFGFGLVESIKRRWRQRLATLWR